MIVAESRYAIPAFAPVLVTDIADFPFYSRLGWLVEYVPEIPGDGIAYARRKARFIARLYRGAPAIPATAVDGPDAVSGELREWLESLA